MSRFSAHLSARLSVLSRLAAASLVFLAAPAFAQRTINLTPFVDAAKGVSESQRVSSLSDEEEIAVGRDIAGQTLSAYPAVQDEKLQRYLNTVGLWVALHSPRAGLPWRFAAVTPNQINAFAVPGGTVLITSGMLNLVSNEAELACVIGHEIGHITRRHHLKLLEKEMLTQTGVNLLTSSSANSAKAQLAKMAVGEGAQLFSRSLDRGAEREADADGVLYAARAGYDPIACLLLMQRMAGLKGEAGTLEALYKTHPDARERVDNVQAALTELEGAPPGSGARPMLSYRNVAAQPQQPGATAAPAAAAAPNTAGQPAAAALPPTAAPPATMAQPAPAEPAR